MEVVGNADKTSPEQIGAIDVNVGIIFGLTVIVKVVKVVDAHWPVFGVKVYVVVAVLFNAGDQLPVMPFVEIVGNAVNGAPEQIAETAAKVGVLIGLTVIVNVVNVVEVHWPGFGVKVYIVVVVLSNVGDQLPVIPFVEIVGNAANGEPLQIGETAVKVGVIIGLTVIVIWVVVPHSPEFGVKVYVVVAVLFKAGVHTPITLLVEVVGNADKTAPEQIAVTWVKVGVIGVIQVG